MKKIEKELNELITNYAENKSQLDTFKKIVDKDNTRIKDIMKELDVKEASNNLYTAKLSVSTRTTMDEDQLLEVIKTSTYMNVTKDELLSTYPGLIKIKEVIDMDVLEDLIYKGVIKDNVLKRMSDCKTEKEVVTLRVSKK